LDDSIGNDGNGNIAYDFGGDIHSNSDGRKHAYDPGGFSNNSNRKLVHDPGGVGYNDGEFDSARDDDDKPSADICNSNGNGKIVYDPGGFSNSGSRNFVYDPGGAGSNHSTKAGLVRDNDDSPGDDINNKSDGRNFVYDPSGDPFVNSKHKRNAAVILLHGVDIISPSTLCKPHAALSTPHFQHRTAAAS
jgi:hypothetical protein